MKRLLLTSVTAMLAAALVTVAVVLVASDEGQSQGEKESPSDAIQPEDIAKLPNGERVPAELTAAVSFGRFRILPAGSVPHTCGAPVPPGTKQQTVDVREGAAVDKFKSHALFIEPPLVPTGWALREVHAETIVWEDGSRTDSLLGQEYTNQTQFPIRVTRLLLPDDCQVELVNPGPDTRHALTLGALEGEPAVFMHQAPGAAVQPIITISFVHKQVLTTVEAVAIDLDELTRMADALLKAAVGRRN